MSGPFRDSEAFLLCPRCGDVLGKVFDSVQACTRCEGTWTPQSVVERAFGEPTWPQGPNAWWRQGRDCPECAVEGTPRQMLAVFIDNVLVDRCRGHGAWFDQGELCHVLGSRDRSDLGALHRKLDPAAEVPDLTTWRIDEAERESQLASYRARQALLIAERKARAADAEAERTAAAERERIEWELHGKKAFDERQAAEREREIVARADEARKLELARAEVARQEAAARLEVARKLKEAQDAYNAHVADAQGQVTSCEEAVLLQRIGLRDAEEAMAAARARLHWLKSNKPK